MRYRLRSLSLAFSSSTCSLPSTTVTLVSTFWRSFRTEVSSFDISAKSSLSFLFSAVMLERLAIFVASFLSVSLLSAVTLCISSCDDSTSNVNSSTRSFNASICPWSSVLAADATASRSLTADSDSDCAELRDFSVSRAPTRSSTLFVAISTSFRSLTFSSFKADSASHFSEYSDCSSSSLFLLNATLPLRASTSLWRPAFCTERSDTAVFSSVSDLSLESISAMAPTSFS
mmetsp:Transcript_22790/g.49484  ORF Transcript_22790/g.49484 Transcript_22790/m.49484 type:complete len:231 (-) Transcript_22790:1037-1729(-)